MLWGQTFSLCFTFFRQLALVRLDLPGNRITDGIRSSCTGKVRKTTRQRLGKG
ncbi:hypothetical protein [Pseudovibrio denitrificans]|uniref:hypothetical protein n=1 Tax=Pseudovibrio denitrificans TaxID=258256 RepID=UPI001AD8E74F|nr:hypothetical protein [Pseudovibrio denitrificans]